MLFAIDCVMVYGVCFLLRVFVCVCVCELKEGCCVSVCNLFCDVVWFGFAVLHVCLCVVVV